MGQWSAGSVLFSIYLLLFWPLFWGGMYWIVFRDNPFTGLKKDLHNLNESLVKMREEGQSKSHDEDDYWEYEDGEAHTYVGPSVRHPKNSDRAYKGSA